MLYIATINTPGHLPMDDEPPIFDTAREAWQYLIEEVDRTWDSYPDDENGACIEAHTQMHNIDQSQPGTIYAPTPGYDGHHDLGVAYSVVKLEGPYYSFPGYDDIRDAESALQEWFDTQELDLDEEQTEMLYQFTDRTATAEFNIRAIQQGADYAGIDLTRSPLPTLIEEN